MAQRKIRKLKVPTGTDEVNFGETRYPVNAEDHTVEVPEEAAETLIGAAGCVDADPVIPVLPHGFAWVQTADLGSSCSFNGVSYAPDAEGFVAVPLEAVPELAAHGFVLVDRPVGLEPSASQGAQGPSGEPEAEAVAKVAPESGSPAAGVPARLEA